MKNKKPILKKIISKLARLLKKIPGYDNRNWLRIRQIESFTNFLEQDGHNKSPVLEISPGWNSYWEKMCLDYTSVHYPDFDICKDIIPRQFRIVIADQVLEHTRYPIEASKNIFSMTEPGGWAMVSTPFLFRIHARPHDYSRWTPAGLKQLLIDDGFKEQDIQTFGWGNKSCVKAHIGGEVRDYGFFRDLNNDEEYPIIVWAFAYRTP